MDSDQGKLFIGGLSWETSEEKLKEYFGNYGEVLQTVIVRDKMTGRPRGFGFVVFADPLILDMVLQNKHTIDGRTVEAKRALSRNEHNSSSRSVNTNPGRSNGDGGNIKTKKIFVGGLPLTLTEEEFRQYFETYGNVTDVVVMYDQSTQRPRGFGFISFDTEDAVDRVLHKTFHELNDKLVEVKRALPKDANSGGGGGYGTSSVNTGAYGGGRMDSNSYVQNQAAGGGFSTYGSSGYGAPNYGYGGYMNINAGYSGPTGGYGNPNAPNAGYVSGPPGGPGGSWTNQPSSGYGSTGYGAVSAPTGQYPSGAAGYGNQGYGYGESEGSYANPGGYGAVGGHPGVTPNSNAGVGNQPGAGPGYTGNGYGDGDGKGFPNAVWKSDHSQNGSYGAAQMNGPVGGHVGYGGVHSGQARQQ